MSDILKDLGLTREDVLGAAKAGGQQQMQQFQQQFNPMTHSQAGLEQAPLPQVINPDPYSPPGVYQPIGHNGIQPLFNMVNSANNATQQRQPSQFSMLGNLPPQMQGLLGRLLGGGQ